MVERALLTALIVLSILAVLPRMTASVTEALDKAHNGMGEPGIIIVDPGETNGISQTGQH